MKIHGVHAGPVRDVFEVSPVMTRDISGEVLDERGLPRVLPASYWATTTPDERAVFGHRYGLYSFPTVELVDYLRDLIGGRPAIEIGAGHGVLATALDIPATDSKQHEMPEYKLMYNRGDGGHPPAPYGPNVIHLDAAAAVYKFRPKVVIACWVSHKFNPRRPRASGNERGVNEGNVIDRCETYVLVGNEAIHRDKPIWERPHTIIYPGFVYSRARNGSRDFIATWGKRSGS